MGAMDHEVSDAQPFRLPDDALDRIVGGYQPAINGAINAGIDGNPDQAAHAVRLQDISGVPAPLINNTYDEFVPLQKKAAAQGIVNNNPDLQAYVLSHPLAATVSADDWAALDEFSRQSKGWAFRDLLMAPATREALAGAAEGGYEGAKEGFGRGLSEDPEWQRAMNPQQNVLGPLGAFAASGVDLATRLVNMTMGAVGGAATGGLTGAGFEPTESQRITEALMNQSMAEAGLHAKPGEAQVRAGDEVGGIQKTDLHAMRQQVTEILAPYAAAREEPPTGLHPSIDQTKAQINQMYVDALEEDLAKLTASTTRERAPDLLKGLVEGKYGDSTIGLHADAVLALYGDKVPEANDGLLGWVPNIETQLMAARDIGADVIVPNADWLAKVDPAVAKGLRDDIRVWPGGVTAREATELPTEPRGVIADQLPMWRASMSSEPKFSMGDRKLQLLRGEDTAPEFNDGIAEHKWAMLDENGQEVGSLFINPSPDGKGLYVNWIGGQAGLWANSFGPALMRDLKAQLKAAYPEREYLAGFRISGAREKAGRTGPAQVRLDQDVEPRVGLDDNTLEAHQNLQQIFENAWEGKRAAAAPGFRDVRQPHRAWVGGAHDLPMPEWYHDVNAAIQELSAKLNIPAPEVWTGETDGGLGGMASSSGHIMVASHLTREQALATGLHELGHHVDFKAFSSAPESLRQEIIAAWRGTAKNVTVEQTRPVTAQRYTIPNRQALATEYHTGFPEWFAEQVSRWFTTDKAPTTAIEKFFKGIADLWQKIYEKVTGHIGLTPEVRDFMKGLWREDNGQAPHPLTAAIEGMDPVIEGMTALQAASVGQDLKTFQKLQKAIRAQAKDDLEAALKVATRQQTKRLSAEWAKNQVEVAKQVSEQIRQKPDIAADLFLGSGEYGGQKMRQRFTLAEGKLTDEQKAALPAHYVSKNGLDPDHVGALFGYNSGTEMVDAVAALQKLKVNEAGQPMRMSDWLRQQVKAETDRQMEARYGDKAKAIADAAKDQALSDSSINVMHEELLAAAQKAGVTVFDKATLQQAAKDLVAAQTLGQVNSFRTMQDMGRHGRAAEKALLSGNFGEAAVHMQRQTLTAMVARELKDVEKAKAAAEKFAKRWAKRDQPSVPPEYANWIHQIMQRTEWGGKKVLRTPEDIARQISGEVDQTLEEFVRSKSLALDPLEVWDGLFDPNYSNTWKGMTVEDFRRIDESLRNLVGIGKAERQIILDGEALALDEAVTAMLGRVEDIEPKNIEEQRNKFFATKFIKGAFMRTLQVENVLNMLDGFSARGPWTKYMFRELKEGDNHGEAWRREYSKRLLELRDGEDLRRKIPNQLFRAPELYGGELLPMTRGGLRQVMLNWGTKSNRVKLARGYKVEPEQISTWINEHADEKDWAFVKGVWKIFEELKDKSDTMERSMGKMATKSVEPVPIATRFGMIDGGYYPVMYHRDYARIPAHTNADSLMQPGFAALEPAAGFTESRTGFVAPMALDLEQLPSRLNQVIHRTAMLPSVTNFAKLLYEPRVRAAVKTKLGVEMYDMLDEYIKGVANRANYGMQPWQDAITASEFLRANVTTGLVGFNVLGTAVKHGSTAWVLSLKEAGTGYLKNFATTWPEHYTSVIRQMFVTNAQTAETRYQFAMRHSLELQRRDRNYLETLTGSTAELDVPGSATMFGKDLGPAVEKFMDFRQRLMDLASKPLAFSDKLSSVPTWLATYDHEMANGSTHGDAVYMADRAVRRAHGSTAITSRPLVMNSLGGWLTTFYNFFNDVFNRQVETLWRAGDVVKLTKEKDYEKAMAQAKLVAYGVFAYAIWPALTEEWVSPQKEGEDEGWAKWAAKGLLYTEGATMPVVRDLVNGLLRGKVPDVGMVSTVYGHMTDLPRDLMKKDPFSPQHAQTMIKHAGEFGAVLTAMPEALVKPVAFAYGVHKGLEHPKGPWGWLVGARYGTLKGHSETLHQRVFGH